MGRGNNEEKQSEDNTLCENWVGRYCFVAVSLECTKHEKYHESLNDVEQRKFFDVLVVDLLKLFLNMIIFVLH